ncbi:multicopper oxidase family protein [Synechococcus sp. BSF8S]|nr:multicopper oxidase family protein [Synechococcus sp. BSF8S]MBC1265021.1 multicopper oxidase family protein [Synechococcus sp. BSA11S]
MRRRQVLALGLAGLGSTLLGRRLCAQQATTPGLADLELVARPVAGRIPGGPSAPLTYNGLTPGPLLELQPDVPLRLRLRNELDQPTNLHFHGLHIPPSGSADNVFLSVLPGESFDYAFTLPADHPAGLFYYHPHHHGTTADQVFAGLGGALVVRGALDRIPEVAAATEAILVLKDFASADAPQGQSQRMGMGMGMGRALGRQGPLLTVNGQLQPSLELASGGLIRLRLLNASNARIYRLALEGHPLVLIATDGGAIGAPQTLKELVLAPGERADLLVQGNQPPGTYRLLDLWSAGRPQTLARVNYRGSVAPLPLPTTLIPVPALPEPQRTRRFVLSHGMGRGGGGMGMGMGMGGMGAGGRMGGMGMIFLINGRAFAHARTDTRVTLGDTEDWLIVNGDPHLDHPFHLHINPFQVISRNGRPEPQRQWKDTVLVRSGEEVRLRVAFRDFPGRTVYHCHNLDHEEMGMMGVLQIEEARG